MIKQPKRWTRYLPSIEFYLKIPLISIQTRVMREAVERMSFDYLRIRVMIYKWEFSFDTYRRFDSYFNTTNDLKQPSRCQKLRRYIKQLFNKFSRKV